MDFGNCVVLGGDWGLIWSWLFYGDGFGLGRGRRGGWKGIKRRKRNRTNKKRKEKINVFFLQNKKEKEVKKLIFS